MAWDDLKMPSSERLLIAAAEHWTLAAQSAITTSLGRGQLAFDLERRLPEAFIDCLFFDLYPAGEARELLAEQGSRVRVVCAADFPPGPFDLVALPFSRGGESHLARDLVHQGFHRLNVGGTLLAAVDNPKDVWLQHEIEKLQKGVARLPSRWGVAYRVVKKEPLKRLRDFSCTFAFRDGERLVQAVSKPGVFSHRQLDLGARALLETMTIEPGFKVLEIGCGSGAVALAAALRHPDVRVLGIDSNARAVACLQAGAALNGVADRVQALLDAEGRVPEPKSFDLVVGNPPYYSHYTIAEIFLQTARRALQPGGEALFVTKQAEWFEARMQQLFRDVTTVSARGYLVVRGRQK